MTAYAWSAYCLVTTPQNLVTSAYAMPNLIGLLLVWGLQEKQTVGVVIFATGKPYLGPVHAHCLRMRNAEGSA